jgi:hypothetical protein
MMKVTLPSIVNEVYWAERSVALIHNLADREPIEIDLSKVEWADPIPLLWLGLELRRRKRHLIKNNFDVIVINTNSKNENHQRFLSFLVREGFYEVISQFCVFKDSNNIEGQDLQILNRIESLHVPPLYANSTGVKAKVIELNGILEQDNFDSLVDELMDEVNQSITGKIGDDWMFSKDHGIQKLRHFTSELIENVIEHAYEDASVEAVAYYVRIRSGKSYFQSETAWRTGATDEQKNCYLLKNWDEYLSNGNSKWIEVFVLDLGVGLLNDLSRWVSSNQDANTLLKDMHSFNKRPLRRIGHQILVGGYTKQDRPEYKTKLTGLQLVHETLRQKESVDYSHGEFIRVITGAEVIGGHLPFNNAEGRGGSYKQLRRACPAGTIYHATLELSGSKIDAGESFADIDPRKLIDLRNGLLEPESVPDIDLFTVDQRYLRSKGINYDAHRRPTDVLNHQETAFLNAPNKQLSESELYELIKDNNLMHLIWLPPDSVTKRDIKAWIEFCVRSPLKSITIADVPIHRARIFEYVASTEELRVDEKEFYIYIITRNWKVATFKLIHSDDRCHFEAQREDKASRLGLEKLNKVLRVNDSKIFWSNILNSSSSAYIAEDVIWDKGSKATRDPIIIRGYLDFVESISNTQNFKIIKASLERNLSLWAFDNVVFQAVDDLIKPFVAELKLMSRVNLSQTSFDKDMFDNTLLLGSTFVTGGTSDRLKSLILGNHSESKIDELYILKHPSSPSKAKVATLIEWLGCESFALKKSNDELYERIEGTPYVKRGGTHAYKINRQGNGTTAYPMYREFAQGNLKLGHWEYSSSHDLLTPNLARIISTNPNLARWFVEEIKGVFSKKGSADDRTQNILLYISHRVTKKLIDLILQSSPDLVDICEIHPLQKVNIGAPQNIFFSPIALEKIENYAKSGASLNIVLIDDGVISGSTIRNAEACLLFGDRDKLTTLTILDRNGFVATDNVRKSMRRSRKTYWSWDVPSLGRSSHCQLCHSIEVINSLAKSISNKRVKERASIWSEIWKVEMLTESGWDEKGAQRQYLSKPYTMKFGHPEEFITHSTSTTLASMSVEISNSSLQPDFSLQKFYHEKHDKPSISNSIALEILCCHMWLLGDGLSVSRKLEYYVSILNLLWRSEQSSVYTSFAGLLFGIVEDQLKPLLWKELVKLISKDGFSYNRHNRSEDLELASFALMVNIPNIRGRVLQEIGSCSSASAREAFLFLLSLLIHEEDIKRPIRKFYKLFGSARGAWHRGQLEEELTYIDNPLARKEVDLKSRFISVIRESIETITELSELDLICRNDTSTVIEKLDNILVSINSFSVQNGGPQPEIKDFLINSRLLNDIWSYAQSKPADIEGYIKK